MAKKRLEHDIFGRPPRKDGINSKKKGDTNERVVASLLSDWTGVKFTRVPRSGGLDWKNNDTVYGDVVSTDRDFDFMFSVETKFYKDAAVATENLRKNSIVYKFWKQCEQDAYKSGKIPLLMIRKNGMSEKTYILYISAGFYMQIGSHKAFNLPDVIARGDGIVGMSSTDFFKYVTYREIEEFRTFTPKLDV